MELDSLQDFMLGRKETIRFTGFEEHYEDVDAAEKIYRKVR